MGHPEVDMKKQVSLKRAASRRTASAGRQTVPHLQMGLFARISLEGCRKTHVPQ